MGKKLKKVLKVVAIVVAVICVVIAAVALCVVAGIIATGTLGLSAGAAASFGTAFMAVAKAGTTLIIGAILSTAAAAWQSAVAEEKQQEAAEKQSKELTQRAEEARRDVENHNKEVFENSLGDWDGGSLGFTEDYDPPKKSPETGAIVGGTASKPKNSWIPVAAIGAALTAIAFMGGDDGQSVQVNP